MVRSHGGYIGPRPAGPNLLTASGVWDLRSAERYGRLGQWPENRLLTAYPSAALAYSLRYVGASYAGPVVQLRRSSDGVLADFFPDDFSNGSILGWAGSAATLQTWYDQSGSGRNATQASSSLQPDVVSSSALILLNGKPSINWPAASANKVMTATVTTSTAITAHVVFSAAKQTGVRYTKLFNIGPDSQTSGYALTPHTSFSFQDWQVSQMLFLANGYATARSAKTMTTADPIADSATTQNIYFGAISSSTAVAFINKAEAAYYKQVTGDTSVLTDTTFYLGNNDASVQQLSGRMQEVVIWTTDRVADRVGIETNAAAFYNL